LIDKGAFLTDLTARDAQFSSPFFFGLKQTYLTIKKVPKNEVHWWFLEVSFIEKSLLSTEENVCKKGSVKELGLDYDK